MPVGTDKKSQATDNRLRNSSICGSRQHPWFEAVLITSISIAPFLMFVFVHNLFSCWGSFFHTNLELVSFQYYLCFSI